MGTALSTTAALLPLVVLAAAPQPRVQRHTRRPQVSNSKLLLLSGSKLLLIRCRGYVGA